MSETTSGRKMSWRFVFLRPALAALALVVLAVTVAACSSNSGTSGGTSPSASSSTNTNVSGTVSVMAIWSGQEQKSFRAVLDEFEKAYPNVKVTYTSAGDNLVTVLSTAVQGGKPPSLAFVAQPGLVSDFVSQGKVKPIEFARDTIEANYSKSVVDLGTVNGKLYSMLYKGANKSTVWYNVKSFNDAGVTPPKTWDEFLKAADTLNQSGIKAYSIGGADGWTLTDLFENIYLRQAGPDKYDQLTKHQIPWTDASVKTALTSMAQVIGDEKNVAGGAQGALQVDFPGSVAQVFKSPPKAAMVMEGDFVESEITNSTSAQPETDFNQFPFPSINNSPASVVGGGDSAIMFEDTPAARALIEWLATPQAASIWAARGGFSSPNKNVDSSVYKDPILRATATALAKADVFRFDMSDLAPSSFGGTQGQGEWKILQDFLANPTNVNGTAQALEKAAAKAYGK